MADTTVWLQIEPQWSRYRGHDGEASLAGIKVANVTQNRPKRINGVAVKVTLRIPDGAFMPLRPTVIIDVPEAALNYEPVVTVEIPEAGDA